MATMDLMDRMMATARLRLPGATEAVLKVELFNTIDTFFRESNAYRYEATVPIAYGERQFPIFPPSGTTLVQVMGADHNGNALRQFGGDDENSVVKQRGRIVGTYDTVDDDALFEPDVVSSPGGIFAYSIFFPTYITIEVPASAEAAQYPVKLVLALSMDPVVLEDAPGEWPLPEWMFTSFFDAWMSGLQFNMMAQPNKPWSNAQLAAVHGKLYRKLSARARQTVNRGFVYNTPRWAFPRFGGQK